MSSSSSGIESQLRPGDTVTFFEGSDGERRTAQLGAGDIVSSTSRKGQSVKVFVRPGADVPDLQLVARVAESDLEALGLLFDRYEGDVKRLMRRLSIAPHEIDDAVQLTFLDVARVAERFDGTSSVRAWIFGIALMIVRRHRRSVARLAAKLARWKTEPPPPGPELPDELLDRRLRAEEASRALARLSPKKREAFVMVVLEGMPGEEAARVLAIPLATLWTRLHHARRDLRKLLGRRHP